MVSTSVLSPCDAWVAGTSITSSSSSPLIERWNGHSWKITPTPDPTGRADIEGIAAISARYAWAVGTFGGTSNAETLILHWNGKKWRRSPAPDPGGTAQYDSLSAVAASSPSSAWAVGAQSPSSGEVPLALHWTGNKWKLTPVPVPAGSSEVLLRAVTTAPHGTAWAVGQYYNGTVFLGLVEHWLKGHWHIVSADEPTGSDLWSVTMAGPDHGWAAGDYKSGSNFFPMILRLSGGSWSQAPQPITTGGGLIGVTAPDATSAWAVGYVGTAGGEATLMLQWRSGKWHRLKTRNPGGADDLNVLAGVSGHACGSLWAVGYYALGAIGAPSTAITGRC